MPTTRQSPSKAPNRWFMDDYSQACLTIRKPQPLQSVLAERIPERIPGTQNRLEFSKRSKV
jgi:hypothetical protein